MSNLNYEFFDEFKSLDNLCRDIYGKSIDNKLGVTLYLEDMDKKSYQGASKISGWTSDYNRLKSARNKRNELAHSRNYFTANICSQEDVEFIRSFKLRILNQTDPIALLRRRLASSTSSFASQQKQHHHSSSTHIPPNQTPSGCLSLIASLIIVVSFISFLM